VNATKKDGLHGLIQVKSSQVVFINIKKPKKQ